MAIVVAAVSVDAETALANGASLLRLASSSSVKLGCVWKRLGSNCDVANLNLLTFDATASRTCGFEREVFKLLSLASGLQLTLLLLVHDKFFFNKSLLLSQSLLLLLCLSSDDSSINSIIIIRLFARIIQNVHLRRGEKEKERANLHILQKMNFYNIHKQDKLILITAKVSFRS